MSNDKELELIQKIMKKEKLEELIQVVCCNKCIHLKDDICTLWKKESGFQTKVEKPDEYTCTGFNCPLPIIDSEEEF